MGLWFPDPRLAPDEIVAFRAACNLFKGKRTIGGLLSVTDRRLVFVPNHLDGALGGHRIELELTEIVGVNVEQIGTDRARKRGLGASMLPQVEITTADRMLVFTVSDPVDLVRALGGGDH